MMYPEIHPKNLFVLRFHRKNHSVLLRYSYVVSVVIYVHTLLDFKCVSSEPNPIMAFPDESGSYSLFPNEDLRTGKKIRFEEDLNRDRDRDRSPYRTGDRYRTYPIMFEDRYNHPRDYNYMPREQDTRYLDSLRTRGSRVYFDDDRSGFASYDRYPPDTNNFNRYKEIHDHHHQRPSLLNRPLSPVTPYQEHRPFHHHYRPDVSPGPSHSKLPIGAGDSDVRIHVYDPASNSFGNPRNSGKLRGDRSRPGNFIETGGPPSDLFINHDQYLEYHRKIAIARDLEFRKLQKALENKQQNEEPGSKKVLFASKQPFDIAGLSPPNKGVEVEAIEDNLGISMKPIDVDDIGKVQIVTFTGQDGRLNLVGLTDPNNSQHKTPNDEVRSENTQNYANIENKDDQGGGTTGHVTRNLNVPHSAGHAQGDEVESENAKSQVTQILSQYQEPKNFISKSGRQLASYQRPTANHNNTQLRTSIPNESSNDGKGDDNKNGGSGVNKALRNNRADGTDFQLPSRIPLGQEVSSIGGAQALPLIQSIQSDKNGFAPNVPVFHRLPGAERPRAFFHQLGSKGEKSELGTEMTISRIKSKTASKVAIIKQQELKQRQKLKHNNDPTITKFQKQNHDQLTKTTNTFKTIKSPTSSGDTQSSLLSPSSPSIPQTNFRIPVLPVIDTELKSNSPYLVNNDDDILGLNRHDINNNIVNQFPPQHEEDGHFTLINLNNDQVDIHDPHGEGNDGDVHVDDHQRPHLSGPLSSYSTSDLDHGGDTLLYLGTTDNFVNKTLKTTPYVLATAHDALNNPAASNFIKVVRVKNLRTPANYKTTFAAINNANSLADTSQFNLTAPTADKTLSMFMAKKMDYKLKKISILNKNTASSSLNDVLTNAFVSNVNKMDNRLTESSNAGGNGSLSSQGIKASIIPAGSIPALTSTHQMSMTRGVIAKVHAHVSHCPKLHAPAEVICDIHIRDSHGHPNPQLTVGWRRKFYNSTQPDVLLALNKTQVYDDDGETQEEKGISNSTDTTSTTTRATTTTTTSSSSSIINGDGTESAKSDSLEDFHDKFNVTLAPGISPMLRSVLLIRGVSAPDTGNYQCEVSDGFYTLTSETLLFLCH